MEFPGGAATAVLALYYLILVVLAAVGSHRLLLVILWARTRRRETPRPALGDDPSRWPVVTVQLPLYNERYVASRLLDAVAGLDYPAGRLEIQVLDDSTDETREIVAAKVAELRRRGLDVHHLHRRDRTGFKAGALAAGLERARGELVAFFDADFVPRPDFLRETVPHFADPAIGMVQGRWTHINRSYSLLTRIQAMLLDGHFLIEHAARNRSGRFFNFNGTAGVWRRQAIADAGGWTHDTLTEDLDLSYRAQLAGWRFLFLPEVQVPAELPVDVNGFKSQQHRWAKGAVQTGKKLLGRIFRAPLPWWLKLEAAVHLGANLSYPLMVALSLLVFPAMVLRRGSDWPLILLIDLPLFVAATLSVLVFYVASQLAGGEGWRQRLKDLPALMGLGIGLAVSNSRAVLEGLFGEVGTFVRTPKYRIEGTSSALVDWRSLAYRTARDPSLAVEGLLALGFAGVTALAVRWEMWLSLPFLYLFLQGYSYMFLLAVAPAVKLGRRPTSSAARRPGRAV